MTELVILQLVWIALGVGFNLVSHARTKQGMAPLMKTPPLAGIVVLSVFVPIILFGLTGWLVSYLALNFLMAVFISYTSIFRHLKALFSERGPQGYSSVTALLIGAGINLFGVGVTMVACINAFGLLLG